MKRFLQVYEDLKEKIASGQYPPGSKLPSKRTLADRMGYSLSTVEHALDMLTDEGYVTAIEKRGYFVTESLPFPTGKTGGAVEHLAEPTAFSRQDFPYSAWFRTVRKVLSDNGSRLFLKAPNRGCEVLRNALADYLLRYRGMRADPEKIIIGSGAEQLYETVIRLLGRDKVYATESPCYHGIENVYSSLGIPTIKLKMGGDGIEKSELSSHTFDVLHVTPFHSYPSGISTSAQKKREYLAWVQTGERYLVEDDFDSEFCKPTQPVRTLFSMDTEERVIYINTFSKSLSPAMRIGYMILPDRLLPVYEERLGKLSCSVPVMDQYILAQFISSGAFERHLNRTRRRLSSQIGE